MPCTPFVVATGPFIPLTWSTALSASLGGKTVTRAPAGPNPGITVTGSTGSVFHPTLGSNVSKHILFGADGNVLILESGPGPVPSRNVTLIDFSTTPPTEKLLFLSTSSTTGVHEPIVHKSAAVPPPADGKAFLIWSSTGTEVQNLAIRRSDNGDILCVGPPPFVETSFITAEATAAEFVLRCSACGPGNEKKCPLPTGRSDVTPNLRVFPEAVLGGAPVLAITTDQLEIKNVGNDCLIVTAIGNVAPFSVQTTSPPLPAQLTLGQSVTVTVLFAPPTLGPHGPAALPVTRTPAVGEAALNCQGTARAPVVAVGFNSTAVNFGTVPLGGTQNRTLLIKNAGEKDLNVSVAAAPAGSVFHWPAFNGVVPFGGNHSLALTFAPPSGGAFNATLSVASDDPDSPQAIALSGAGCVANAAIDVPPTAPIDFGQVERGFRSVRFRVVRNPGDGPLTFTARIAGADAALYGLQPPSGSLFDVLPQRSYVVDPIIACGPLATGSGETLVAVAFHANGAPGLTSAQLVIEGHNATNTTVTSFTYPLAAEIIAPVAVDAAAVFDRSGSMSEPVGERVKSEAEIAAGQLFARLARPDVEDRLTLVKFFTTPEVLQPIVAITSANQASVVAKINATELAPGGATSIAGGVLVGLEQLAVPRPATPPQLRKAMVVLTDGKDNRAFQNPADGQWYSLLGGPARTPGLLGLPFFGGVVDTLPVPVPPDVKIYAVGIGKAENVDVGRLNVLTQATGAFFGIVGELSGKRFFDLEKHFTQIYMDTVGMGGIADPVFTIAPGDEQRIEFDVLRGDVRALVVVYDRQGRRLPFHLASPPGELIDASQVPAGFQLRSGATAGGRFLEVVMPADEPDRYAGRWAAVVVHPGEVCFGDPTPTRETPVRWGFLPDRCVRDEKPVDYGIAIGVSSNLTLRANVTPGTVHTGEPILLSAVLSEAGLPVAGCTVAVRAVSPGGSVTELTLPDEGEGDYARQFLQTAEAGSYDFTFRATGSSRDGKPVTREAVRAKYVVGRLPIDPLPLPDERCCRLIVWPLWIGVALLALIAILLLLGR